MNRVKHFVCGVIFSFLVSAVSCGYVTGEVGTRVRIEGAAIPKFIMTGSGKLAMLKITGPKLNDLPGEASHIYWQIEPQRGHLNGISVRKIGVIEYGSIPEGYEQRIPVPNQSMPRLQEGVTYQAEFDTTDAPGTRLKFKIQSGIAVEVEK